MLRHTSLPFFPASMLNVLTQIHPSPTVTLTYAHTHQTSLLLAHTQRDTNIPSLSLSLSLSVTGKYTHTHIAHNSHLPYERNTWCWPTRVDYWEVLAWCLQCNWHHALCAGMHVRKFDSRSECIFVLYSLRLIFNLVQQFSFSLYSSLFHTHTHTHHQSPYTFLSRSANCQGQNTNTQAQFHCRLCDSTSHCSALLCQSLSQESLIGLRWVMTAWVCMCSHY